jgi:hypothetical protein
MKEEDDHIPDDNTNYGKFERKNAIANFHPPCSNQVSVNPKVYQLKHHQNFLRDNALQSNVTDGPEDGLETPDMFKPKNKRTRNPLHLK